MARSSFLPPVIAMPASSFEPQLVKKGQTRITSMDDQILSLYARGMSTRDIVADFKEMYGADISAGLVSQVSNAVMETGC